MLMGTDHCAIHEMERLVEAARCISLPL